MTTEAVQSWMPQQQPITMTQPARDYLRKQIDKQGHGVGMRLGVKKTGCSGLAYKIELVDEPDANDHVYEVTEDPRLLVVVAPKDLPYVQGTQIDFGKDEHGGLSQQFKYHNPNEQYSCGCGESFGVAE